MKRFITSILLLWETGAAAQLYFPGTNGWETTTPVAAGVDSDLLQQAINYAGTNQTKALVILHNGRILSETYWDGWTRESNGPAYSASKSMTSVLTGIAIAEGHIASIDQPSADFLSEWAGDPSKTNILIRHHLTMSTGLEEDTGKFAWFEAITANQRWYAATQFDAVYPPGTRWYYHNPAYRLLFYILEEAVAEPIQTFSDRVLFDPIGMDSAKWVTKVDTWFGQTVTNYQWLSVTALDAARFGLLALADGKWDGTQIVSQEWLHNSTVYQYEGGEWYGRLWWLNAEPSHKIPLGEPLRVGPIAPDAPPDTFMALGKDDQKIYVVPSLGLVVARLGDAADISSLATSLFDNQLLGRICKAFGYTGREQPLDVQLVFTNANAMVSVPTWNGRHYTFESTTNLVSDIWQARPNGDHFIGDGTLHTFDGGSASNAYYKTTTWSQFD